MCCHYCSQSLPQSLSISRVKPFENVTLAGAVKPSKMLPEATCVICMIQRARRVGSRLGHVSDRVNLIYSHSEDQAQMAASQAIARSLDAARTDLQEKRKAGSKASLSLLSVTLTVTPNQGVPLSP
jgi:hypothetical protein